MDSEERKKLKTKIEETIVAVEAEIARLEEDTQPISPDNAIGRLTRMDAINNKSVAEANLRSARKKLANLQVALSKIDSPDFGNCQRCGRTIQPARLMYMPGSTLCVRCAE